MAEDKMKKDLEQLVQENLPGIASKTILDNLKERENLLKENELLRNQIDVGRKQLSEADKTIETLKHLKNEKSSIEAGREKLESDKREWEYEKKFSALKVEVSQDKVNMMNNFVGLLMKNPQAVTFMNTSHIYSDEYNSQSGNYEKVRSSSMSTTRTEQQKGE